MLKDLINIHKILSKNEKRGLIYNLFFKIILSIFEAATVLSFVPFLSMVSNQETFLQNKYLLLLTSNFNLNSEDIYILVILIPLFAVICMNLFRPFVAWHSSRTAAKIWLSKSFDIFNYYLNKNYLFHINNSTNTLLEKLLQRTNSAIAGVIVPSYEILGAIFSSIFLILIPILYDPYVGLICFFLIIFFYFVFYQSFRKKIREFGKYQPVFAQQTYKLVDESFKSIKDIKLRKNYNFFSEQYWSKIKKYADNSVVFDLYSATPRSISEIFGFSFLLISSLFLLVILNNKFASSIITLGVYLLALQRLIPIIQNLFQQISQYKLYKDSFYSIYDDFLNSYEFKISSKKINNEKRLNELIFNDEISLKNIEFSYPNNKNFDLKVENLIIKKGEILGISGKSGHGKSTFINIICGLLEPSKGKLFVDKKEVNDSNIDSFQKNISYVPQNIFILDDTIEKNIAFGVDKKSINIEKVKNAARIAGISEFIENELEKKYETIVGENAIKLSGGQRQRLGLARSLYEEKQILILDEATNSLDKNIENQIINNIYAMKNKTIILVTHNQLILKRLPKVLYFDKGKLNLERN